MKYHYSRIIKYGSLVLFLFLIFSCASLPARTEFGEPKSDMFSETQKLMDRAVSERADEFAPEEYAKAVKYYEKAEKAFEKEKDIAQIEKNLEKAQAFALDAINTSKTVQNNFPTLIESRDKAIAAGADEMDLKSYTRAEKFFYETCCEVEQSDMVDLYLGTISEVDEKDIDRIQQKAQKAMTEFQKAELEAIQKNITGDLQEQLEEAKNQGAQKWAPQSYKMAEGYLNTAMETLENDRYNQQNAQKEADMGEYYARKSAFLTEKIKEAKGDKDNWEKLYLQREEDLSNIAMPLNIDPAFDEGFEEPVNEIDEAIRQLRMREQALNRQLMQAETSLAQTRQQMYQAKESEEKITSELQMTESTLRQRKLMEEKLKQVQKMFPSEKAKVTIDPESNITISLLGLNFDFGKSELKPEYHPLLNNIHQAAQIFPDRKIRFSGHTDSLGSSEFNKRLSLERAKSVANYMEKKFRMKPDRFEVIGAGETEPIAANTALEGRKLNRRIDVIFLAP